MAQLKATLALAKKLADAGLIRAGTGASYNKTIFSLSKYYKYGLLTDDLLKENDYTKEAIRRLPKDVYQERQYRIARATVLSANKSVLPESEWLKPEQDVSYLKPFVDQMVAEQKEKDAWNSGKLE